MKAFISNLTKTISKELKDLGKNAGSALRN
jgi:hypothetical protein